MLAKTPTGSMADVYREAWKLIDAADSAERYANAAPANPLNAEIVPGSLSDWYVVRTYPGDDMRALRYLTRRRFGVFRPMRQKVKDGMRYGTMEPVYPGMLLVFCWDIDKMRSRILACPGVMSILCDAEGRAVNVDVPDDEGRFFIEKLRELSFQFQAPTTYATRRGARLSRKARPSNRIRKARAC